jgi:hypothetical protein
MSNALNLLLKKFAADAQAAAAVSPDAPNVLQAMMQLEQAKTRAKAANKLALDAEKEKDASEQEVQCCNSCYKPRELEHMLQLPMTMRSVISSHRTTGTSLIIVVRLHAFKTAALNSSRLSRRSSNSAGGQGGPARAFSTGACGMDCLLESWKLCSCCQSSGKAAGEEGSRVGCQGVALGEARCVGLCTGSGAMVH